MAKAQAAVVALCGLIIAPGYLFYFDVTGKIAVLLIGTAGLLVAMALSKGTERATAEGFYKGLVWMFGLSILSLAFASIWSRNRELSLFGTNWRHYGMVVQACVLAFCWLLARHTAGHAERTRTVLRGIAAAGALTGLYGIAQYFGFDPFLPAAAYHIGEGIWTIVRPPGTLGYVSYFATWLLFSALLSTALASMEDRPVWRRAAWGAAGIAVFAMLLTGTRAAIIGLAAGILIWLWWSGARAGKRAVAAIALALAAGAAFYFSPAGWPLRSRTRWFVEDAQGGARLGLWKDSLQMAAHRLPAGYGPEVFTAEFARVQSRELARAYPDFAHESPHNIFLDSLVAQGVPGLLVLVSLCGLGLSAAHRVKTRAGAWLGAALLAGTVSQCFTVFTAPTALLFYATIALAAGMASRPMESKPGKLLSASAVAVAAIFVWLAVRLLAGDHALAKTRQELERGNPAAAAEYYRQYDRWRWPGTSADLWYSRTCFNLAAGTNSPLVRLQALAQAGTIGLRATRTAEDPFNAWYSAASLYASRGDAPHTELSLRQAIAASPNWFKPHWGLARLLEMQNRTVEAQSQARLAADLAGGKFSEVSSTLQQIQLSQR